ncbi:MAG TPA: hypothetical protein PLB45_02835 [Bacilli bacterium]|nr:hypothetical protein [Bacilli bacterium]
MNIDNIKRMIELNTYGNITRKKGMFKNLLLIDLLNDENNNQLINDLESNSNRTINTKISKYSILYGPRKQIETILLSLLIKNEGNTFLTQTSTIIIEDVEELERELLFLANNPLNEKCLRVFLSEISKFIGGCSYQIHYHNTIYKIDTSKISFVGLGKLSSLSQRILSDYLIENDVEISETKLIEKNKVRIKENI